MRTITTTVAPWATALAAVVNVSNGDFRSLVLAFVPTTTRHTCITSTDKRNGVLGNCVHGDRSRFFRPSQHQLHMATAEEISKAEKQDAEIVKLRAAAAKLRAEASALEAERAEILAKAAEKAFKEFDTNQDGEVCLSELKTGLEKKLKTELTDERVEEIMEAFDASGDMKLQPEEFVTIDTFSKKLESLVREEKDLAAKAAKEAQEEAEAAALEAVKFEILNERPPTNSDKLLSIIPYILPLLDGLQYGRFLLTDTDQINPLVAVLAILYTLYRSIPFSGFVAFLALSFLSANPKLNRLVRFNMQQAIFIDIAMILPGLLFGLASFVLPAVGVEIPTQIAEVGTDATFIALLLALGYCTVSSVLGITPDNIPLISDAVKQRMPTMDMFDDQGRFIGPQGKDGNNDDKSNK